MAKDRNKLTMGFMTHGALDFASLGLRSGPASKKVPLKASVADFVDHSYADLPVLETNDSWCGDPRDMGDEDLAFFNLER